MSFRFLRRRRSGFLLMEVLLGITVFSLFVGAVGTTLLYGQENTIMAGDRIRATQLAQRSLDAGRSMRDTSFASLTPGTHGVWVDRTTKKWAFSGSSVTTSGGYIVQLTVTQLAADWVRLDAQTKWKHGYNRSGSVLLSTDLTDWSLPLTVGDWSGMTEQGSWTAAGTPILHGMALSNTTMFIGSEYAAGRGLYVLDISNLAAPQRIASSFDLGFTGYDVLVRGMRLYVLTSDPNAELKVYDITTPSGLSAGTTVATYDLPGSGWGRTLALRNATLIVGAIASATMGQDELYTFDISDADAITLQDSLNNTASIMDIAVSGTAAILATTDDGAELIFADIETPTDITFPANQGYNATDNLDGISIAATGTSAVLGRNFSTATEEMILFSFPGKGYEPPPPGPWFYDVSSATNGSVYDISVDPSGCYAFLATNAPSTDVRAVRISSLALPPGASHDASTGVGRGVLYDITRDRLFLITDTALHVLQPNVGASSCAL